MTAPALDRSPGLLAHARRTTLGKVFLTPKGGITGAYLLALVLIALLAPWITPYPYDAQNLPLAAQPPSLANWLGTDEFGRDVLRLSGTVLDDDLLAERLGDLRRDQPPHDVAAATGRITDDHAYGFRGIFCILGLRRGTADQRRAQHERNHSTVHVVSIRFVSG